MQNLLFFLWMLLYPIFDTYNTKVFLQNLKKAGRNMPNDNNFTFAAFIAYIIYFGVAYLLYKK